MRNDIVQCLIEFFNGNLVFSDTKATPSQQEVIGCAKFVTFRRELSNRLLDIWCVEAFINAQNHEN